MATSSQPDCESGRISARTVVVSFPSISVRVSLMLEWPECVPAEFANIARERTGA
jgi:hypothetical protein